MSNSNDFYDRRNDDHRLNRIEEKIDKLAEAMISIARIEEKISSMDEDREVYWEKLNKLSAKVDILEKQTSDTTRTIGIIHKLFWFVVAASVTYYIPSMLEALPYK